MVGVDHSGHHTALYGNPADPNYDQGLSVDQTVQFLRDEGAPAEKIVIGAAFYTRGWHEVAEDNHPLLPGLFQTAEQSNRMLTSRQLTVRKTKVR